MAPGTRTPNERKLTNECARWPRDLNTRLADKTDTRLRAVFRPQATTGTDTKHRAQEHWSQAFNARLTEQIFDGGFCAAFCTKGDSGNLSGGAAC